MTIIIENFKAFCESNGLKPDALLLRKYIVDNNIVIINNVGYTYKYNNTVLEAFAGVNLKIIKETEKAFGLSDKENDTNLIWLAKSTITEIK